MTATRKRWLPTMPGKASAATWRCASTQRGCWAASRGWCCMAAATPPARPGADLLGDEWDVLCVKGSGWDMGVIEPQGLPAVKMGALLKARALTSSPTKTWSRCSAQPDRPILAQPLGRDAAACLPAAQIRRPHPFDRHPRHRRSGRQRIAGEDGVRRQDGLCALHHAGLRPRQGGGRCLRRRPDGRGPDPRQAWHLHFRRRRQAGLRPDDPLCERRRGLCRKTRQAECGKGCAAGKARHTGGHRADAARRRRGGARRRPLRPHDQRLPHLGRHRRLHQLGRDRRLCRTRRVDARFVDPHQDRTDGGAGARCRQDRRLQGRDQEPCRRLRQGLPGLFRNQRCARRRQAHHARPDAAR